MYRFLVDQITSDQWYRYSEEFASMNIYQAWHYADLHCRGPLRNASRAILLNSDGNARAMAQLRIKKLPMISTGVADVEWGPLWNTDSQILMHEELKLFLRYLKQEYVDKRKLIARIWPRSVYSEGEDASLSRVFAEEGFQKDATARPYHTVMIDLSDSVETIRKNLHRKWRNHLSKAERSGLTVEYLNTDDAFDRFFRLYQIMWTQKRFPTGVRVPIIGQLQRALPSNKKFLIIIIKKDDIDIGGIVCPVVGDTLIGFLAASLPEERASNPGNLSHWSAILKAKEMGFKWYDVGGYDDQNPALAEFKTGMSSYKVVYPGCFVSSPDNAGLGLYNLAETSYRKLRRVLKGR